MDATPGERSSVVYGRVAARIDYPAGMATYSAHEVAAEIRRRIPGVPVKKLHKLLYYAQAHHLVTFRTPLFSETISAWDMGPVVPQLWWAEKNVPATPAVVGQMDEAELNTIGYVVSRYGNLSGLELERLTHSEDPWIDADAERKRQGARSQRIPGEAIADYFAEQAAEDDADMPVDMVEVAACIKGAADRERDPMPADDTREGLLARLR